MPKNYNNLPKIKVKHDMNHCFGFFIYSGNEKGADGDP